MDIFDVTLSTPRFWQNFWATDVISEKNETIPGCLIHQMMTVICQGDTFQRFVPNLEPTNWNWGQITTMFPSEKYWPKITVTERLNLTKRAIVILNNDSMLRKCICRQFQKTLNRQTFRNNDRHTISAGKSSEAER